MANLACFEPLCKKEAEYLCNCSSPYTVWCSSHMMIHLDSTNIEHPIEAITKKNPAIGVKPADPIINPHGDSIDYPYEHSYHSSYEYSIKYPTEHHYEDPFEHPYEISIKKPNQAIESTLALIYKHILEIEKIKNKFREEHFKSSYCCNLINNSLKSIEQYNEILDEMKIGAEYAQSIDDFPLSLMEIMNIIDNINIQIEFLEKLNDILLLENQVKRYWIKKFSGNSEMIGKQKSELNRRIEDIESWCFCHKNNKNQLNSIDNQKIGSLLSTLKSISALINNNFESKYFFQIKQGQLLIYGTEAWRWTYIALPIYQHSIYSCNAQVIELPNYELFCLGDNNYAFTFDLKAWSIKKIFLTSIRYEDPQLLYYENCVYWFSSNHYHLSCLIKFDLISNKISNLPSTHINYNSPLSCCIYKNSILVCAKKSGQLLKFDLLIESYSELPFTGSNKIFGKMLFTGNMRAYIVDHANGIFESEIENEFHWNKIGIIKMDSIEKYNDRGSLNLVYFSFVIDDLMEIYLFDLGTKKIYKVESDYYGSIYIWNNNS